MHRKEVYEAIRGEKEKASRVTGDEFDGLAHRLRVIRPDDPAVPAARGKTVATTASVRPKGEPTTAKNAPADGRRRA